MDDTECVYVRVYGWVCVCVCVKEKETEGFLDFRARRCEDEQEAEGGWMVY